MKETLTIRNFGPIKDITLDLRKVNVFIGESGTGKSIIHRLIGLLKDFRFLKQIYYKRSFEDFLEEFNLDGIINTDTFIEFKSKEVSLFLEHGTSSILKISDNYLNYFKEIDNLYKNVKLPQYYIELFKHNEKLIQPIFIPAERSFVSKNINIDLTNIDSFTNFQRLFYYIKNEYSEYEIEFLNMKYKRDSNNIEYVLQNNITTKFSNSASGFQSIVPLMLCNEFCKNKIKNLELLIEEPELNLFPTTQFELVKNIIGSLKPNQNKYINTHSPYILTSLNNLMYAYKVGRFYAKEVSKIIPKKYWVNPKDVSCYLMEDGEAKSIIDGETKLIDTVKIDGVSDTLSEEFNKIMALELA